MTEEISLIGILIAFSGSAVAYIKWLHDRALRSAYESFENERKLYDARIGELREDKERAEKSLNTIREETMNFINSVNYVSK